MEIFERACILYTMDGELPAKATDDHNGRTFIQSDDATVSMTVYTTLAQRKYEADPCPTFFNC